MEIVFFYSYTLLYVLISFYFYAGLTFLGTRKIPDSDAKLPSFSLESRNCVGRGDLGVFRIAFQIGKMSLLELEHFWKPYFIYIAKYPPVIQYPLSVKLSAQNVPLGTTNLLYLLCV